MTLVKVTLECRAGAGCFMISYRWAKSGYRLQQSWALTSCVCTDFSCSCSKTTWGLHLLFRWYGSAIPRALPFSLLSAMMTGLLFIFRTDQFHAVSRHLAAMTVMPFP